MVTRSSFVLRFPSQNHVPINKRTHLWDLHEVSLDLARMMKGADAHLDLQIQVLDIILIYEVSSKYSYLFH